MAGKAGDVLKGKIAILSVNALGVDKFHTTPTVAARSGAEIHAVLANQLLDGKFLFEPADAKTVERVWLRAPSAYRWEAVRSPAGVQQPSTRPRHAWRSVLRAWRPAPRHPHSGAELVGGRGSPAIAPS